MRNLTHPTEAELALYAGGDLSWVKQRLTDRHVRRCGSCQSSVSEFSELRPEVSAFPSVSWMRLQSELVANIRLGLSAGECVSMRPVRRASPLPADSQLTGSSSDSLRRPWQGPRSLTWSRLGIASAVLLGLAGVSYIVEHPPSGMLNPSVVAGSVIESSDTGLQAHDGSQTLRLLNTSGKNVSHSVGSRGELGARYVDTSGYVTISQIYGQ